MEPGDQVIVTFTVEVDPDANGVAADLDNQAVATGDGQDENGDPILDSMDNPVGAMDDSDSGADPNSDNPGEPGNDGMGGTDDATPLEISDIGVAKQINSITPAATSGEFDVEYVVVIANTGTVDLTNLQAVENLANEYGAGFDSIQTGLVITASSLTGAAVAPTLAAWDGDATDTFFDGTSGLLEPGNSITLTFTARIDTNAGDTTAPTDFTNQVDATGDGQTSDGVVPAMDSSDNGTNPSTDNGEGGTNDPTPLQVPQIRSSKTYGAITANADGSYTVPVTIVVENSGTIPLSNLSLIEDIEAEFGNALLGVNSPAISAVGTFTGVLPQLNSAWGDGNTTTDVIDPAQATETLPVGESYQLTFNAVVDPDAVDSQSQPLMNQATVSGDGTNFDGTTITVMDDSGADDTVGTDGTDNDLPSVLEIPEVRTTKAVTAIVPNGSDYDITVELTVENTGTVDLTNLDLFDGLNTQMGGGLVGVVSVAIDDTGVGTGTAPTLNFGGTSTLANPFDGGVAGADSDNLLNNDGTLPPGESFIVTLTYTLDPTASTLNEFENTATGGGDDPAGNPVTDPSDSGSDPNSDNPGEPGDTGGHNDPTPITFSEVSVAKEVAAPPTTLPNGNFSVPYSIVLQNTGTTCLLYTSPSPRDKRQSRMPSSA